MTHDHLKSFIESAYDHAGDISSKTKGVVRDAVEVAVGCTRGDVRPPCREGRKMLLPREIGQQQFNAHDARQGALNLDVEAGEDRNPMAVVPVLIRIPGVPPAA